MQLASKSYWWILSYTTTAINQKGLFRKVSLNIKPPWKRVELFTSSPGGQAESKGSFLSCFQTYKHRRFFFFRKNIVLQNQKWKNSIYKDFPFPLIFWQKSRWVYMHKARFFTIASFYPLFKQLLISFLQFYLFSNQTNWNFA